MSLRIQNLTRFQKEAATCCASDEVRHRLSMTLRAYELLISEGRHTDANEFALMIKQCLDSEGEKRERRREAVDWRFRDLLIRATCTQCQLGEWKVVKKNKK